MWVVKNPPLADKKAQVVQSATGGVGLDLYLLPTAQSAESACRLLKDPAHFGEASLDLCYVLWIKT